MFTFSWTCLARHPGKLVWMSKGPVKLGLSAQRRLQRRLQRQPP